jgi:hypothetical protein
MIPSHCRHLPVNKLNVSFCQIQTQHDQPLHHPVCSREMLPMLSCGMVELSTLLGINFKADELYR